jgi:hypothetical protein
VQRNKAQAMESHSGILTSLTRSPAINEKTKLLAPAASHGWIEKIHAHHRIRSARIDDVIS